MDYHGRHWSVTDRLTNWQTLLILKSLSQLKTLLIILLVWDLEHCKPEIIKAQKKAKITTLTKRSNFVSIHIWFVTNMRQEQTLCITLDLIWRKQQVGQKLAFYFWPKLVVCSKPSQICVILKWCSCLVKPCSNAAHQLVDHLFLLCR